LLTFRSALNVAASRSKGVQIGCHSRAIVFGPFRLFPCQRILLEGDVPLRVGSRALDMLIAFLERPGDLISKSDLMERVWPNTCVKESNFQSQHFCTPPHHW
jgi:DNA-binding winged helix-turn-helix (wHTH) protein